MSIIDLQNVNKTFNDEPNNFEVLKDISISINEGEFVCIVGPSGCGKSVLLSLIAGFTKPTSGIVQMKNIPVVKPDRSRILMFQNNILLPWKTVLENVIFGLEKENISKKQKNELALYYLDLVGLLPFKDWYTHKLSGGMQQKVALARSLIANPKILLMDEPFSALDIQYRRYFRKTLEEIWEKTKKTIILVTHDVTEAVHLADTIYVLSACPAKIKSSYKIDLLRPRGLQMADTRAYLNYIKAIKKDLIEEFEKKSDSVEFKEQYLINL